MSPPLPQASRLMVQHLVVGFLQGGLVTWLHYAKAKVFWPVTAAPELLHLLVLCVAVMPWAVYLSSAAGLPRMRRIVLLLVITLLCAVLGAYSGWLEASTGRSTDLSPAVIQALGVLAITFMLVPLVAAWQRGGGWSYSVLFELAWRNALLVPVALGLTGVCWGVLWAGAGLLSLIGLGAVSSLLAWPPVTFGLSAMVLAVAFAQGILRAELLLNLRRFVLSLNAWLLPVLLGFGVVWVVALPFTGVQLLFATGSAAFLLLGFLVLAVLFLNAAWQDGQEPPPYGTRLARWLPWATLTLPVIAAVALWALLLRVQQYGWTEERLWAFVAGLLLAGYSLGYASAVWRRRPGSWLPGVGQTNIVMALAALVCIALLTSPVADPRRLAVADQVQRLMDGKVAPDAFDYGYLANNAGRWGQQALTTLAALEGNEHQRTIAEHAAAMLSEEPVEPQARTLTDVQSRLTMLADTPMPDEAFLQRFLSPSIGWQEQLCWSEENHCAVYAKDLNADGLKELLLIVQMGNLAEVHVYTRQRGAWEYTTRYAASEAPWVKAILDQTLQIKRPGWPELEVGGEVLTPSLAY